MALSLIAGCRGRPPEAPTGLDGPTIAGELVASPQWSLVTSHLETRYGCTAIEPTGWVQEFGRELGGDTAVQATFQSLVCPGHRVTLTGVRAVGETDFAMAAVLSTPPSAEVAEDRLLIVGSTGELHDVLREEVAEDLAVSAAALFTASPPARTEGLTVEALTPEQIEVATTACQRLTGVTAPTCPAGGCNGCECMSDANLCAGYLLNQVVVQSSVFWAQQCMAVRNDLPGPTAAQRFYCSDDGERAGCVDDRHVTVMRASGDPYPCTNPAAYDRDILNTSAIAALNGAVGDLMRTPDAEQQAIRDLASLVGTISAFVPVVGLLGEAGETAERLWGHLSDAVGLPNEMSTLLAVDRSNFERFLELYGSDTWGDAGGQYYCWRHRREAYTSTDPTTTIRPPRCAPQAETPAEPVFRCGIDPDAVYADLEVDYTRLDDGDPDGIAAFGAYCVDRGTRMLRWDGGDWYFQDFRDDYSHGLSPYGSASADVPFFCCEADVRVSWPNYDDTNQTLGASDEFRWARRVPMDWQGFGCGFFTGATVPGATMGVDIRTGVSPWGEACTWAPYTTPADAAVTGSDPLSLPVGTWLL